MSTKTKVALRPVGDKVVVRLLEREEMTAGGLVIPETAKEKPQEAEVLAVGPGRIDDKGARVAIELKEGQRIIFSKYSGTEVKYKGEEYLIISEKDILAVVEA